MKSLTEYVLHVLAGIGIFAIIYAFFLKPVHASEWKLIDLDEVRVDYMSYFPGGRDPLISYNGLPDRMPGKQLNLNVNVDIAQVFYWNSTVHSTTDAYADTHKDDQFRLIGLQMEFGLRVCDYLDVFYYHHSQHLLDTTYATGGFPVEDAVGIHIYFYRKNKKEGVF